LLNALPGPILLADMSLTLRTSPESPQSEEFGFLDLATVLLRHRRRLVLWPLYGAIIAAAITLLLPRTFLATAAFTPQSGNRGTSTISGIAAQFGVVVPTGDADQSPDFYADLVKIPTILRATVETEYHWTGAKGEVSGDLVKLLDISDDDRPKQVEAAMTELTDMVSVSSDAQTAIVKVSVRAKQPDLAQQIAQRLLDLVNDFNLKSRQSQAGAERQFVEGRLQQAQGELRLAEDSLQTFLVANRDFSSSPQLQFKRDRLQQSVTMRQTVVASLAQSYEQARIDEVRNTALITVVEQPVVPVLPESRGGLLKVALGILLGLVLASVVAFSREFYLSAARTDRNKVAEFEEARDATRHELAGLRSRLGRLGRGSRA